MSDIVERLESPINREREGPHYLCTEAADEIKRLRGALADIVQAWDNEFAGDVAVDAAIENAREALDG